MKDLKIRVDNDAESREAQELFFELGYKWFSEMGETKQKSARQVYEWRKKSSRGML